MTRSSWSSVSNGRAEADRKSTRLNSSHSQISYAVFCLKKKKHDHVSRTDSSPATPKRTRTDRHQQRACADVSRRQRRADDTTWTPTSDLRKTTAQISR